MSLTAAYSVTGVLVVIAMVARRVNALATRAASSQAFAISSLICAVSGTSHSCIAAVTKSTTKSSPSSFVDTHSANREVNTSSTKNFKYSILEILASGSLGSNGLKTRGDSSRHGKSFAKMARAIFCRADVDIAFT